MNFSESLEKFIERGSSKYIDKRLGHFSIYDELPISSIEDIAEDSYKECSYSLKPIVLKLVEALGKYKTQSCSSQNLDMAAKEALAEVSRMIGEGK